MHVDYTVIKPNSDGNNSDEFAVVEWGVWTAYTRGERKFAQPVDRRKTEAEAEALKAELIERDITGN
jgi:hypothetical protein